MKSKKIPKHILPIMVFVVLPLIVLYYFFHQDNNIEEGSGEGSGIVVANALATKNVAEVTSGFPVNLKIPSIKVNAMIEYVGLTPKSEVGVPKGPSNVGWFNLSPVPGKIGSSVIVGHFGWKNGIPAAFDSLSKLKKDDKVYTINDIGATSTFKVVGIKTYDPKADAQDVFNSTDGKAHLNLITCEGAWNKVLKSYSNRLIVFTEKVSE